MNPIRRGSPRIALVLGLLAAALFASSANATTWTEIPSNTTQDITAVEYQGADRFWFATSGGRIYRRVGGVFQEEAFSLVTSFKDIEFQDGGQVGFAVGTNGTVMRSADGGDNWTTVAGIAGGRQTDVNVCNGVDQGIGDVDSVRFAGNARVWLAAGGSQIYRTRDGATAANVGLAGNWQWINDDGATCRVDRDIDDFFPVADTGTVFLVSRYFGTVFLTTNWLTSSAAERPADAGNGFSTVRRIAGDPGDPSRMWSVTPDGEGGSYYQRTTDGWSTSEGWVIANPDSGGTLTRAWGVDFNGGTVLAAGSAGMIVTSIDGATFYFNPAGGSVTTQDWRSVSLASANDAAVGGTSGKLLLSSDAANVIPPPAPPAPPRTGGPFIPVLPANPTGPPRIGLPSTSNPPVTGGVARAGRRFVTVPVSGRLTPPRGVSASVACRGKRIGLKLSKTRGRRRLLLRTTVRVSRSCRYRKQLRVRRSKLAGARALLLQVSFRGSSQVGAARATYTIPVI